MTRKSAKSMGFRKGDFVFTGAFPGILVGAAHTSTPVVEVWGYEQETGSVYSQDLRHISWEEFRSQAAALGHSALKPYSKEARKAIQAAEAGRVQE